MQTVTNPAAVQNLVARWSTQHPELAGRLTKAASLVGGVRRGSYSANVFFVAGESDRYMVRVNRKDHTSSCTCPDHQFRGGRCKHILAAALVEKARA